MGRRRLLWQLIPSYLLITVLVLTTGTILSLHSIHAFHLDQAEKDLEGFAHLISRQARADFISGDLDRLNALCRELSTMTETRITAMHADGRVLGDSHSNPADMDNHANRPEMHEALAGRTGISTRFSHTLQEKHLYVAVPVRDGEHIIGAVRTSITLNHLKAQQSTTFAKILKAGLVTALIAMLIGYVVSRNLSSPLRLMTTATRNYAKGDFSAPVPVPNSEELGQLAEAMNRMSSQLNATINTIRRERSEQDAVLTSMAEGVLAVDHQERIIKTNRATCSLLGLAAGEIVNKTIQESIRNPEIQKFIQQVLTSPEPQEQEVTLLKSGGDQHLHIHGNPLQGPAGEKLGALFVFRDVTRLKILENMRRDFVANVSHELKTPITTIKGFVETLQEGAMDERENAERFLSIISRQADRLTAIINDILSLSRLEQEDRHALEMQSNSVREMLKSASEACEVLIQQKNIRVTIEADGALRGEFKRELLEQAVVNLIDNAVKYSDADTEVVVRGWRENTDLLLQVSDRGRGIAKDHLDRVFERFYRVDKARSREMGGTGLGLAIVKHIAQAHGGSVSAQSEVGRGSTFTIRIPGCVAV